MKKQRVTPDDLVRIGTASHITRLSTQHLYRLARARKLDVVTVDSVCFFHRQQIEALAAERREAHA
ncbi:MAG TPA: hypothetical protein VMA34_02620 [Terracidiphilus sp.]|nr:hypothetical protein [Terracidiphilus sp.]